MFKKLLLTFSLFLPLWAIPRAASSSVVGEWQLQGTLKSTVRLNGSSPSSEVEELKDRLIFRPDGSFEMIGMRGVWRQKEGSFIVSLDPLAIEQYFEQGYAKQGLNVATQVTTMIFKGTEQNHGTINGKVVFRMNVFFLDLDSEGEVSVALTFTATRSAGFTSHDEGTHFSRPRANLWPI